MDRGETPPRRSATMAVPAAASILLLLWGALPYLTGQIDDAYIVFAYAHRVVEHGEIAWNTGERVEGYSSPLHLLAMVVGCALHLDLSVFARVVSIVAAVGTLLLLLRSRFGPGRAWLAFFVAAWQPFQLWSVAALETSLATLLATAAWPLVFAGRVGWAGGCLLLMAFSLARPEGAAWLGVGVLLRLRYPWGWGRPERVVVGGLTVLAGYHVARVGYFGDLLPTPWLVKIVAIDAFGAGAREASYELASALPLVCLVFLLRKAVPLWVWTPLAIQTALLVRAGGDWMGHARFLLPGVVASAAAGVLAGQARSIPRWAPAFLLPLAALSFAGEPAQMQAGGPRWRDPWFLRRPLAALSTPWSVPLLDEVTFLISRIPPGAGAELSDVGLPGNLDDIRIWDGAGLTDRAVARIIAGTDGGLTDEVRARYDDPTAIWCLRYGIDARGGDPADAWLQGLFPEVATSPRPNTGLFWRCRAGGYPDEQVIASRWERLLARFPRQDGIRWQYARALVAVGRVEDAMTAARGATWIGADAEGWAAFPGIPGAPYSPGRGWPLYANGVLTSASLPAAFWNEHTVELDADDPGPEGVRVEIRWQPACGDPEIVTVRAHASVRPPTCASSDPRSMAVEFSNDEAHGDFDRNAYVTLSMRGDLPG